MSPREPFHGSAFPSGDLFSLMIKMSDVPPHQTSLLLMCFSTISLFQAAHCPFSGGWRGCQSWGRLLHWYWPWKTVIGDPCPLFAISPTENAGHFLQAWDWGWSRILFNISSWFLLQKWSNSHPKVEMHLLWLKYKPQSLGLQGRKATSRGPKDKYMTIGIKTALSLGPHDVTVKPR